jgi:multifunctional beta-oxidation protein
VGRSTWYVPFRQRSLETAGLIILVAVLVHKSNIRENGSIFEAAAGHFSKIRWQRSEGLQLRPDETLTPDALLKHWSKIADFSKNSEAATNVANSMDQLQRGLELPKNTPGESLDFSGKVVLVTGGGEGLGRAYAHLFARLGAKVAVNDVVGAETVANDINARGADAIAISTSVEKGDEVVKAVIDKFKRIDIIVNNAGILRDKAFTNMSDDLWFPVINVHLRGIYKITKGTSLPSSDSGVY